MFITTLVLLFNVYILLTNTKQWDLKCYTFTIKFSHQVRLNLYSTFKPTAVGQSAEQVQRISNRDNNSHNNEKHMTNS